MAYAVPKGMSSSCGPWKVRWTFPLGGRGPRSGAQSHVETQRLTLKLVLKLAECMKPNTVYHTHLALLCWPFKVWLETKMFLRHRVAVQACEV